MHIDQSLCKLLFVQLTDCIFNPIITEILNPKPGVDVSGFSADVYSFGVVVWEIVTCDWPHKDRCLPSDAAASSCVPLFVIFFCVSLIISFYMGSNPVQSEAQYVPSLPQAI